MSKKTLRKRIALVAVSALGAGLFVAAPSANAAAGDPESFDIAITASITGSASTNTTIGSARSTGFVYPTNTAGTIAASSISVRTGAAQTATVLPGAAIAFNVNGTTVSASGISVVVTGGSLTSIDDLSVADGETVAVNGARTTAVAYGGSTTQNQLAGIFTVSAAAGATATMSAYTGTGIGGTTTATSGTLIGSYTFTVVSAATTGVLSTADSDIYVQAAIAKSGTPAGTSAYDATTRIANGNVGVIWYDLEDAYATNLSTGTVYVQATNGANVIITPTAAAGSAFSASAAFDDQAISAAADSDGYIIVTQPVAGAAGSSTVTISYNGTVVATKTLNWNGDIASIEVDTVNSNNIFLNGDDASGTDSDRYASGIVYVVKDAAGNVLDISSAPSITGTTGALVGASLTTATADTFATLANTTDGYGLTSMIVPTSDLYGKGTYKIRIANSAGVYVVSKAVEATVSYGIDSFSIAFDKTTYKPGEIATMTVSAKDSKGNPVADGSLATGYSFVGLSGFTNVGTTCNSAKAFSGGVFTCKWAAGNDDGSYSYSFDVSTGTPQSAATGSLAIASGAISNAEVLAGLVKLIAAINKQINLLMKQIKKMK